LTASISWKKRANLTSAVIPCCVILGLLSIAALPSPSAVNYAYDAAGRLTQATYDNGTTITYTYDPAGNLLSRSVQTSSYPAFFNGQAPLGSGVYYLQFPDNTIFGYYNFPAASIFYHYDLGFEAYVPGSSGTDIYLYDFTSSHWWYTNASIFPSLYDFTLNNWLYYFPNTQSPGHYTTNPRYFSDLTTGEIITM
jgi:YD repeat-containing protein